MFKLLKPTSLILLVFALVACSSEQDQVVHQQLVNLQAQIDEQKAIEEIRALFADYGRSLDNRDYEWFASLYAPDATYVAGGEFQGPEAIAQQLESVISANATGANLHVFANETVDVDIANGTATATSRGAFYVQDESGIPTPLIFATYSDKLVSTDEGWKFQRREIVGDIPGPANEDK